MSARTVHTATFLFTDIENSTLRWEADADGMAGALARHDALMAEVVQAAGGDLFKHTGDGIIAMFPSAAAAVAAAVAAQRRLELPVRMGLDSGEAESRGGDWFGPVLNRAARVMAAAHGGQILITPTVLALAPRLDTIDHGSHRLRGLSEPVRLLQVCDPGLRRDFPPPRTPSEHAGNVLPPATPLVGRDLAVGEVADLLGTAPVVTLTGPGGVGKSLLAQHVAETVSDDFPDGAWFVELAAVRDAAAVPDVVATTLGAQRPQGVPVHEVLTAFMAGRRVLVVLDNCEHVLDAAAESIGSLLARAPRSRVLATSREGLGVTAERLWPVPTLPVDGEDAAAITLFCARARAVRPDFELDPASRDAVVAICRELDGLALAIELAAARTVAMSPQEIRARLDHRFRLLSGRARPGGHRQTLEQMVSWSYDLLDHDERRLFERCSVFAGGFNLDAAVAISTDVEPADSLDVLDLLDALVRKSLLTVQRNRERTRYGMLETIRHYAAGRLEASGESDAVRARHAAWFADAARACWERWNGPEQGAAVAWAESEIPDLRAAFRWAADHDELDLAVDIASYVPMVLLPAMLFEPVDWAVELVERATLARSVGLTRLLTAASNCAFTGGAVAARDYARRARELALEPGFESFPDGWMAIRELGALRYAGPMERWHEITEELVQRTGLDEVIGLGAITAIYPALGRSEEARALVDRGLAAARATGNPFLIAFALGGYGRSFADVDPSKALEYMQMAIDYARLHGNRYQESTSKRDMAGLQAVLGDPAVALEWFDASIQSFQRAGNRASVTTSLGHVAITFDRLGRSEDAATIYGISIPWGMARLADLPAALGHLREVLGQVRFDQCVAIGSAMDFDTGMQWARSAIARARDELARDQAPSTA